MTNFNETALKDRLRNIAKANDVTFNEIWKRLVLERFLVRLSRSEHSERFIFKGGLLLSYLVDIGRETVDIDFCMTGLESHPEEIRQAIDKVVGVAVYDGFHFAFERIENLAHPHMEYPGLGLFTLLGLEICATK